MCHKENDGQDFSHQDEVEEKFEVQDGGQDFSHQDEVEERFEVQDGGQDFSHQDKVEEGFKVQDDELDFEYLERLAFEEKYGMPGRIWELFNGKYGKGNEVQGTLLAYQVGDAVLGCLRPKELMREMLQKTENHAVELLQQILSILNDDKLDDPHCFKRIEEIVQVFEHANIYTKRHDFDFESD